ncbi:MAG: hypothetical protein ISQ22_03460 [Rhizobiales bacterium]|jgi:hypothetical protein|nr:hypothetical protein [Hyphomicrobiales bacterium]
MSELDLLSKLSRKIFHDLINPASAALNGLELFKLIISDEKKSLLDDEAFLLIEKSASKTLSQLKIYRIAYADITSEIYDSIKIEEFRKSTDDFISHTKLHVNFNIENEQISKWSAVILSNIYILSVQLFPQGAGIHIKRIDEKQLLIELESNSETLNFDLYEQLDDMSSRSDNAQVIFYELLLKNYRIEQNLSKINNKIYLELTLD